MTTCKLDPQLLWLVFALIAGTLVGFLSPSNNSKDPAPWNKLSHFTGWIYFFCWSVSFWPQIYMNYIRKSTEGLSFDYQLLNFIGFACYATFNLGLYYSPEIQLEYRKTHNNKESAVRFNDVLFAIHAFAATCITMFQIFWYRSNTQKTRQDRNNSTNSLQLDNPVGLYGLLSVPTDRQPLPPPKETKFVTLLRYIMYVSVATFCLSVAVVCTLAWLNVDPTFLTWLNVLYYLSGAKLAITIVKYIPQVYENWRRKSTDGWNIWNVLLDFGGGSLSICQLMIDCGSTGNWIGITGDPVKFLLGFVSIIFDCVFMVQHYVLYKNTNNNDNVLSDPLLSGSSGVGGRRGNGAKDNDDEWMNGNRGSTAGRRSSLYDSWLNEN